MKTRMNWLLLLGGLILVIAVAGLILLFSLLAIWPEVLDVALFLVVVITLAALGLLSYAALLLSRLGRQVGKEVTPMLDALRETTASARETVKVTSELTAEPSLRAVSLVLGAAQVAGIFFGRGRARQRAEKRAHRYRTPDA